MSSSKRPLSPHLQVYRPQLTSILSISHRATGVALSVGTLMFVWQLVAAASGPRAFASFQGFAGSWLGIAILLAWSVAFFYHLANGIRHLIWDTGKGITLESAYRSGSVVIVATGVLTLLAWIVALIERGAH